MTTSQNDSSVPLVRNLAVVTQLHLPGTAGRLSQQIRDLEAAAPIFTEAGLVRKVHRPMPLNVKAAGIATETPPRVRTMGGFLYAAGAVKLDILVDDNRIATGTQDSVCEIDDIDYEDQVLRLALISMRQAYEMADAALKDGMRRDLVLLDTPLLLSHGMTPSRDDRIHQSHRKDYETTHRRIEQFWSEHRPHLFPWDEHGTVVVGVGTGRYGAVLQLAQQDLRTEEGRQHLIPDEIIHEKALGRVESIERAILTIGVQRFVQGLLGPFTRTAAYRLNIQSPRMEPNELAKEGVIGFHFKGAQGTATQFAHVLGPVEKWTRRKLDEIAGLLMGMNAIGGQKAEPLPLLLARRELKPLASFLEHYARELRHILQSRKIESDWLHGLDELD